jgi:hypothetical protein
MATTSFVQIVLQKTIQYRSKLLIKDTSTMALPASSSFGPLLVYIYAKIEENSPKIRNECLQENKMAYC